MKKRFKMSRRSSKRNFSKGNRTHKFNTQQRNPLLMRGGIRM